MKNQTLNIPTPLTVALEKLNLLHSLNWAVVDLKSTKKYQEITEYADSQGLVFDYDKEVKQFTVTEKLMGKFICQDNNLVEGYMGTWYVIDTASHEGETVYLLEHEEYGDETPCLIVKEDLTVLCDEVWNGFEDLEYLDKEEWEDE